VATVVVLFNTQHFIPASPLEALDVCNKDFFPNIYVLLKIFATLPVSIAATERSFSALKRIKDYLRSTMAESRLNGTIRYDTRCYFNVRSKADISQLNLPHGTDN